jgi:hypothetical protein
MTLSKRLAFRLMGLSVVALAALLGSAAAQLPPPNDKPVYRDSSDVRYGYYDDGYDDDDWYYDYYQYDKAPDYDRDDEGPARDGEYDDEAAHRDWFGGYDDAGEDGLFDW